MCFFVNSGSEANDLAIALARVHTGRFDILSMRNGYHGMTQTVMGATNLGIDRCQYLSRFELIPGTWKQPLPCGFGILKAANADPYRGPWGGANCRDSPSQPRRTCDCAPGVCEASNK